MEAEGNSMMWGRGAKKYGNKKTQIAGHWFDSKLEAAIHSLLSLRERAGEISSLSHHPGTVFLSEARVQYRPDFRYVVCATGKTEYAEAKGYPSQAWNIKKRMWKSYGPGVLLIYGGSASAVRLMETIVPKGAGDAEEA